MYPYKRITRKTVTRQLIMNAPWLFSADILIKHSWHCTIIRIVLIDIFVFIVCIDLLIVFLRFN